MKIKMIKLIFLFNIIVVLFCVSHAEITKFSVSNAVNNLGIRSEEKLLDYLPEDEVQEIKKLLPHIKKCFYTKDFNSKNHIFNIDLKTIIQKYFVSQFS
mgnify:CR=1 FL=1